MVANFSFSSSSSSSSSSSHTPSRMHIYIHIPNKHPFSLLSSFNFNLSDGGILMKSKFESIREWIVENKLRAVGGLWAGGVIGSLAYNWSQPAKPSVKIIHARLHAQALTLAALAGAAVAEYYDHNKSQQNEQQQRFPKFLHPKDS